MKKRIPQPDDSQLAGLCRQLALLLRAGVGSEEAVELLLEDGGQLTDLFTSMHQSLAEGASLSASMEQAGVFPSYLLQMVDMGERTGRLEQVLFSLAGYYDRQADTARALRRAAAYPAGMALLILILFGTLVSQVLPVFRRVFEQLGGAPNSAAHAALNLGDAAQIAAWILTILLGLGVILALAFSRTRRGRQAARRLFARTRARRAVDRSHFAAAMALMLSSGLPLDEALSRSRALMEDTGLSPALEDCQKKMDAGTPFSKAVEECGIFTGLQSGLLSAGFRTGSSEQAMEELSRRCQEEADERLAVMLGRFEYALVVVLCLAVGLVLLSVMLPLLGVLSAIGG